VVVPVYQDTDHTFSSLQARVAGSTVNKSNQHPLVLTALDL